MSPVAKAAVERTLMTMKGAMAEQLRASRPLRLETLRHFGLDPNAPANPLHEGQEPSPAVSRFIHDEIPFEIDGDFYSIVSVIWSGSDAHITNTEIAAKLGIPHQTVRSAARSLGISRVSEAGYDRDREAEIVEAFRVRGGA